MRPSCWFIRSAGLALAWCAAASPLAAQELDATQDLDRARVMLRTVKRDIERYYFDSTFHGVDLDARYRTADSALQVAQGLPQMFAVISEFAGSLNDSHTRFLPPSPVGDVRYGFSWMIIGAYGYVSRVTRGSDAAAKGLAPGDRLVSIDGIELNRRSDDVIRYVYYTLRPRQAVHLVVEKPDRSRVELNVESRIRQGVAIYDFTTMEGRSYIIREIEASAAQARYRAHAFGDSVLVVRLLTFSVDPSLIDDMMYRARDCRALVLDLRRNGGGRVDAMLRLLGRLFDRPVTVGTVVTRTGRDTMLAEPRRNPFRGEVMVLVDYGSASASEITARVLQLERRATIIGDRTAGAVVVSLYYPHEVGFQRVFDYGVQVSVQDLLMSDGQRLEVRGVEPDVPVLATPRDIVNEHDPALSVALNLVGVILSPADAAQLFRERRE